MKILRIWLERWKERGRKERLRRMFCAMIAMDMLPVGEMISSPKAKVNWKKEGF